MPREREIERKFLIRQMPERLNGYRHSEIMQGYLVSDAEGTHVRLRRRDDKHTLTFKRGAARSREEREIQLDAEQFATLWPATVGRRLTKVRYEIPWEKQVIELDIYRGRHEGLAVAEVEFEDETSCAAFTPPAWFGEDVSGDRRYGNVALAVE